MRECEAIAICQFFAGFSGGEGSACQLLPGEVIFLRELLCPQRLRDLSLKPHPKG
jgi:hypothetical protein